MSTFEELPKNIGVGEQIEPIEEIEKELTSEDLDKVMQKVKDIDERGTAYTALDKILRRSESESSAELDRDALTSILKDGVLGTSTSPDYHARVDKLARKDGLKA